jgi:phosphoglycolate phosphatase/pyrophosphatase PpaX
MDHDDTLVQSELTINYPFFCDILDEFRPGAKITMKEYTEGCYHYGFADMCRKWYNFTDQELLEEYTRWKDYIMDHIPDVYPGIPEVIRKQKAEGGLVCVVSHSSRQNITRDYETHIGILPDDIYGWDYPPHQRKPNVYPLEQIMKKYGLSPADLLVVDDMKPAWEMAAKAGVQIAFAGWGRLDYPEITKEMTELCDYAFINATDLYRFLFED